MLKVPSKKSSRPKQMSNREPILAWCSLRSGKTLAICERQAILKRVNLVKNWRTAIMRRAIHTTMILRTISWTAAALAQLNRKQEERIPN